MNWSESPKPNLPPEVLRRILWFALAGSSVMIAFLPMITTGFPSSWAREDANGQMAEPIFAGISAVILTLAIVFPRFGSARKSDPVAKSKAELAVFIIRMALMEGVGLLGFILAQTEPTLRNLIFNGVSLAGMLLLFPRASEHVPRIEE